MSEKTPIVGSGGRANRYVGEVVPPYVNLGLGVALIANGVLQVAAAAFATYYASSISPPGRDVCGDDEYCLSGRFMRGDVGWMESMASGAFVCYLGATVAAFAGLVLHCLPHRSYIDQPDFDPSDMEEGIHRLNVGSDTPVVYRKRDGKVTDYLPLPCSSPSWIGGKLYALSAIALLFGAVTKFGLMIVMGGGFRVNSDLGDSNDCASVRSGSSQFCDDYVDWSWGQKGLLDGFTGVSLAFDLVAPVLVGIWLICFAFFDCTEISRHVPESVRGKGKERS